MYCKYTIYNMNKPISKPKLSHPSLDKIDVAIPGNLRMVTIKCGKGSCPCASGKKELFHGPYCFWDRKINGKNSTLSVPKEFIPDFKRWIANRKKLEALLKKFLDDGRKFAELTKHR